MGSRKERRVSVAGRQLRIFGIDSAEKPFTRLAEMVDISASGARLSGVLVKVPVGSRIAVKYGTAETLFRVVWAGQPGTERAGQMGIRCIDAVNKLWNVPAGDRYQDDYIAPAPISDRRLNRRFECDLDVRITEGGTTSCCKCLDLSFGGCYVATLTPYNPNTKLLVSFRCKSGNLLELGALVRSSKSPYGMGLQFTSVNNMQLLREVLEDLRQSSSVAPARDDFPGLRRESQPESPSPSQKILVADDSVFLRTSIASMLRRVGYKVETARDGEEALTMIAGANFDLVILDLLMPRMGGLEALRRLRSQDSTAGLPILVMSSLPEGNDLRIVAEGASGYIPKQRIATEYLPAVVAQALQNTNPGVA